MAKIIASVSERALFARIDRALRKDGEKLRRCKEGSRSWNTLGDYYTINIQRNVVEATHVDLEKWGREMKVLESYETLDKEDGAK